MDKPLGSENCKGKIYFFRMGKNSSNMIHAFNSLSRDQFCPEWIDRKGVKIIAKEYPGSILVVDSIDSIEFTKIRKICRSKTIRKPDAHTRGFALRVFTAYSLMSINPRRVEHLPHSFYPIASICMKTLHVAISGLGTKKTRELSRKLLTMNAVYHSSLMRSTEVLVSTRWDSQKVEIWRRSDIANPVVTPEWIDRCYEMREDIKEARSVIDKYKLPLFHGMKFCVSGFHTSERKRMIKIIIDNGGSYSQGLILPSYKFNGEQTQSRSQIDQSGEPLTTHLIVVNKEGPKYESALVLPADQIHIVNNEWFKVSWAKGFPQVESDPRYSARDSAIEEKLKQKALQKKEEKKKAFLSSSLVSDASFIDGQQSFSASSKDSSNSPPVIEKIIKDIEVLLESSSPSECVLFRDLNFFICGLTSSQYAIVKKLISRYGGLVYSFLVSVVTHVVIGPNLTSKNALDINRAKEQSPVSKVSVEWILHCVQRKTLDIPESLDPVSTKILNRISCTQDLDPSERQEVARERAEPKANEMNAKFRELEESIDNRNTNKNVKKGLRIGGNTPRSPFRITDKPRNDSIPCSLPVQYDNDG